MKRCALVLVGIGFLLSVPQGAHAQENLFPNFVGSLVPCGDVIDQQCVANNGQQGQKLLQECGPCQLVQLALNVINFLVYAALFIATILFIYAGVLYVTSGANEQNVRRAHVIFSDALRGLVYVLAAWLLVDLFMKSFFDGQRFNNLGPWNEILCEGNLAPTACLAPPSGTTGVNTGQPPAGPGAEQQPGGQTQLGQPNSPNQECTFTFAGLCIFTGNLGGGDTPNTQFQPNINTSGQNNDLLNQVNQLNGGSNPQGSVIQVSGSAPDSGPGSTPNSPGFVP